MNAIKERAHIIEAILKFGKASETYAVANFNMNEMGWMDEEGALAKLAFDKGQALAEVFKRLDESRA